MMDILNFSEKKDMEKIFTELHRVLKSGGKFLIWDVNFSLPEEHKKKIIVFYLDISLPSGKLINTGYGTRKTHQKLNDFLELAKKTGFEIIKSENSDVQFYLELKKS